MQSQAMNGRQSTAGEPNNGLRRAIRYLGNQKRPVIIAYASLVVATLAQLAVPELIQSMLNSVQDGAIANQLQSIPNPTAQQQIVQQFGDGQTLEQILSRADVAETLLINSVIFIILFSIARGLFSFLQTYMAETTSQGLAFDMRNQIFSKLQRLSFSYYDQNQTGQLMIRATDDVEKVRLFIAQGLILTVQAFLLLFATLIILFATNWRLTIVILPILPLSVMLFAVFGKVAQPLFIEIQKRLSRMNTILQENVAGIKVVQAFVREAQEQQKFDASTDDLFDQQMRVGRIFSVLFPLIFLMANIGSAAILYFAGRFILVDNALTLGEYQKFQLYLVYIFFPLGQLGFIISLMSQASASSQRIFEILDAESDVTNKEGAEQLPPITGNVAFSNVTFRYFNSSDAVLSEVSFTAHAGETIALLGSTGSGKTTIINLIPRFYDVSEGAVLIDGHDVRDVTLDSLRSQIGIVLQETNLFGGSIRDNIAFGRPEATDDEVISAAKAAAAHDFIMEFPDGYNTSVGERGSTLSGGQKQRIAIARALLLSPSILILDDSTSSVDFETEAQIQAALDLLMQGRTSFVIAQRISTVKNADQILVLDKGRVAAMGKHQDLMETSPIYAEIYNSQLVDDKSSTAEMRAVNLDAAGGN
ncbi:MAG: ABC transporter ATP-binding protein [Aggregatilineales bacterium]